MVAFEGKMANQQQGKGQAENGMNQKLKRPRETPKAAENAVPDVNPSLTLEDETTCIICLEFFKDPVIIHCGHSFCRTCITEYWKGSDCNVHCPFCQVSSPQKLLVPNRHLETIVQNYKILQEHDLQSRSPQIKKRISSENDPSLISTAGERSNAHQGHLVENILKCYKLTENDAAAANPSTTIKEEITCTICLEFFKDPVIIHCGHTFCRACVPEYRKGSYICVACPWCRDFSTRQLLIPNRQLQNIIENYKELALPSRSPQTKKRCTLRKTDQSVSSENDTSLFSTAKERSNAHQGHTDFPDTFQWNKLWDDLEKPILEIGKARNDHAKILEHLSDIARKIRDFKERYNLGISDYTTSMGSFLDRPKPTTSPFSDLISDTEEKKKYPDFLTSRRWNAIIKKPGWVKENVLLDPETAHPLYNVGPDRKSISCGGSCQIFTFSPQLFDNFRCVLGDKGFTSGKHYWTVDILHVTYWAVGVAKESVDRENEIDIKPENGIWAFGYSNDEYKALTSPPTILELDSDPTYIRVYLDYDAGIVGFSSEYDTCFYMFESADFGKEKVFPFFRIGN